MLIHTAPVFVAALALAGCRSSPVATSSAAATALLLPPAAAETVAKPPPLPSPASLHANEVGRIPILMYHAVGGPPAGRVRYDREGLNIRPDTFRRHLKLMYEAGWYPVNMRDVLTARLDVPAGKTPVVITFDDARGSQFHYRKDGSTDPDCAVGILEAFHKQHPEDWPRRATFYVLPRSRWNPPPFYQGGVDTRKLRFLVAQGYEVANHTTSHHSLGPMSESRLRWEVAECVRYVRARVPEATMDTLALPYGIAPRDRKRWECLLEGVDGDTTYRNRCILLAAGGPAYPPTHRKFDPRRIVRIGAQPGQLESWIKQMKRGGTYAAYVSDGDPNIVAVPQNRRKDVAPGRLDGAKLVVYNSSGASPKKTAGRQIAVKTRRKSGENEGVYSDRSAATSSASTASETAPR